MKSDQDNKPSRADEEFQELLGSAGARDAVDPRRVAEIKQAMRPAWQEAVSAAESRQAESRSALGSTPDRGARGRGGGWKMEWAWLAAAALVLGLFGWWSLGPLDVPAQASYSVAGASDAFVVESGERRVLEAGVSVGAGAVLVTGRHPKAFVTLVDGDRRSIRVDAASRLILAVERELELLEGRVYVDHETESGEASAAGVGVRTALGTVREIGTQFEVELQDGDRGQVLHAVVRTGRVLLESGSVREEAGAGEELVLADGEIRRRRISPSSDRWAWVLASAPPLDLANATTHDVLRWVARETGRRLVYESRDLELEMARTAIESGRNEVTVDEALAMLPTAGLEVSLEGAELRVRDLTE